MHIHAAQLAHGIRGAIDGVTPATKHILLSTVAGKKLPAVLVEMNPTAAAPSDMAPFRHFRVKYAPPLTPVNPNADVSILITAGPRGEGFAMFDLGLYAVDGPSGVLVIPALP